MPQHLHRHMQLTCINMSCPDPANSLDRDDRVFLSVRSCDTGVFQAKVHLAPRSCVTGIFQATGHLAVQSCVTWVFQATGQLAVQSCHGRSTSHSIYLALQGNKMNTGMDFSFCIWVSEMLAKLRKRKGYVMNNIALQGYPLCTKWAVCYESKWNLYMPNFNMFSFYCICLIIVYFSGLGVHNAVKKPFSFAFVYTL